jgi:hypothetical protein
MKKEKKIIRIISKLLKIFQICRASPQAIGDIDEFIPQVGNSFLNAPEALDTPEDNVW